MRKQVWFKKKSHGWGWTPESWEGLACLFVWGIALFLSLSMVEENFAFSVIGVLFSTCMLLLICRARGEKKTPSLPLPKKVVKKTRKKK